MYQKYLPRLCEQTNVLAFIDSKGVCVTMHVLHCLLLPMVVFWMTNHYVVGSNDKDVHNARQRRAWSDLQRNWRKIMTHVSKRLVGENEYLRLYEKTF